MFTGIITDVGEITRVETRGDTRVVVATSYETLEIDLGASVACSGVCLTVVDKGPDWLAFDVSGETLTRTAQGQWSEGRRLNLERAMKLGDELGGHIVTGHVDGIAEVTSVRPDGDSKRVDFRVSSDLAPFLATKGSVTVDGVSLTVNDVTDDPDGATIFAVNIIPHTQAVTTLSDLAPGSAVNIEIDVLARYLQRMEHYRAKAR
ncbi:riboflavin synthase [Sphingomonas sp. ABOLG]|jgi:riboflavin synthase|uniref:riboflavin synthase n=1 Tax=unclassified Sphingomonas TaxID=196159 RepID=UPI000F7D7CEC|nr:MULTISPECIES: riboflavin synthase [unclassified Sphingomonas]MDF2605350.1 riboflavin synthase subunit alpha [Sphingomonas sp.]RSV15293.1 riboflavin synthase [Sphingomonas sp. ABOLG]